MSQEQNNEKILSSVDEAIEDIRAGKVVIVVDDEDRENEGDFIVAGEKITPEIVNFMLHNGRGVLCAPLTEDRCRELDLDAGCQQYVAARYAFHGVGRFARTRLYDRRGCDRPRGYGAGAGRSCHQGVRSGPSGAYFPAPGA